MVGNSQSSPEGPGEYAKLNTFGLPDLNRENDESEAAACASLREIDRSNVHVRQKQGGEHVNSDQRWRSMQILYATTAIE